ncbi:MAG: PQQ-binding-like beta-propeller repeat protein, partial [Planctomycetota bacterium]
MMKTLPPWVITCGLVLTMLAGALPAVAKSMESGPVEPRQKDPFKDNYQGYKPDFLELIRTRVGYKQPLRMYPVSREEMRVSSEKSFFTLNTIPTDQRANALVDAALGKERSERYREAGKIYQMVIDKYPHDMYRVCDYGVYVPVSQYCQRRILGFPRRALEHYRTLYDPAARESFESARAKNSLIGLSEIADTMLATSYGGRAILELGNANLDTGHYLAALEHFNTILQHVPAPELRTPELELKMTYCRKALGMEEGNPLDKTIDSDLETEQLGRFKRLVDEAPRKAQTFHSQLASAPCPTTDDYVRQAPTEDPLGLTDPVWKRTLPGSRRDSRAYVQPTVTKDSVIYRHKNVIYCHSILNGELRWTCDLGGRAVWQHHKERQYPQERVLVQDGLVFTVMHKTGPSLVALDEVTGQLEWAYGPMVASTVREARMRFEAAPAGGPRTVYAGYVLDNIEGQAHTDTEYGLIAFESRTGRIQWQRHLCRLAPGEFAMGFAVSRRNRIRSFSSPPLYHQGTVYYCTNAGAVAALDGLSGRIKWLMRYPYYPKIHDATHPFGLHGRYMNISHLKPWYNQRPLVVGERLYVLPVDTRFLFCLDRGTGKVAWSKIKGVPGTGDNRHRIYDAGACWFLGPISTGELCFVHGQRNGAVHLVDPKTGTVVWRSGDIIKHDDQPVMTLRGYLPRPWGDFEINRQWYRLMARPFLSRDDRLVVPSSAHVGYGWYGTQRGWAHHFCELSLEDRKIVRQRRYYDGSILSMAAYFIYNVCPGHLKNLQEIPHKDENLKARIRRIKAVTEDHTPRNRYGPFVPFARMTFQRYGTQFELRIGPRSLAMLYDHDAVSRAVQERSDPAARFARAELAVGGGRYDEAAGLLNQCLRTASSEDVDFRASIKQQLYQVNKELARIGIRAARPDDELRSCLGMARTATTLADEIETRFALAQAYERKNEWARAGRSLRSVIRAYGHRHYPVPATVAAETDRLMKLARGVFDEAESRVEQTFEQELDRTITLLRRGLPLYFSTVSPLPKTLTVRAGELASTRLIRLQQRSPAFAKSFAATARRELEGRPAREQLHRLWEFPGTPAAQTILAQQFAEADKLEFVARKRRMWRLADAARICHLDVPDAHRPEVTAAKRRPGRFPVKAEADERSHDFADKEGTARLVLERRGDRGTHPHLLFVGGRTRKRLDNKFSLVALDLRTGEVAWDTGSRIRLKGKGQEPGFHEAFVLGDLVVVHGLYDVLAFSIDDGSLRWR